MNTTADELQLVEVNGRRVAYREAGSGPPVLLIHGWPTSSFLWRAMMPAIAERNRVLAIDLPGFGASDKPLDVTYNFALFEEVLDGFLDEVGRDWGGPVAVETWAPSAAGDGEFLKCLNGQSIVGSAKRGP